MRVNFHRQPGPGETRDCTEPWTFVFLRSNGDVCLCCHTPPVGSVREKSLEDVLEGEAAHELRRGLLTGQLGPACQTCPERGSTSIEVLRARVDQLARGVNAGELADLRRENHALKEVRSELMRERDALRQHAANLEAGSSRALIRSVAKRAIERLRAHIANLERKLGRRRPAG